jgi:hypothetical protein
MAESDTDSDLVTGICEDNLVDNKQHLDPIAFVAVKAEVTVSCSFFISLFFPLCSAFQFRIICQPV